MAARQTALLGLLAALLGPLAALTATAPALAGTARYYYDPAGRLLGETQTNGPNRLSKSDSADNLTYLHIEPITTPTAVNVLGVNGIRVADQTLTSPDGRFTLDVQDSGNLTLTQNSNNAILWQTNTSGNLPGYLVMQSDGNLVLYSPSDVGLWSSNTGGNAGATLTLQSDGNLVLYQGSTAIWNTGTGGH